MGADEWADFVRHGSRTGKLADAPSTAFTIVDLEEAPDAFALRSTARATEFPVR